MCTVARVPPARVSHGGARLFGWVPLVQGIRPGHVGCRSVERGPVRLVAGPILLGAGPAEYCASRQWLGHDTGATINESIAERVTIRLVSIPVLLGIIRSAQVLHIHMIQNKVFTSRRVTSHLDTTNMRLARDMRARCVSDRLRPHAYGHGAAVERESAVATRRPRPPVRSDGSDERARGPQVGTTSV